MEQCINLWIEFFWKKLQMNQQLDVEEKTWDWINFDPAVSNRGSSNSSAVWGEEGYLDVWMERQQRAVRWKRTQCAERLFLDPPCSNQIELNLSQICAEVVFLGFHPLTSPSMYTFATKGHHNHCLFMYWTVRILHYNVLYQMNES